MRWRELHERYGRLLWALHSAWALVSGIAVLVLAHNRYGFVRWIVLFIALTWASTLFFSRVTAGASSQALVFARGVVSYLTRVMYQETLFFLIPFYFYSATFASWNFAYVIALAVFATLSCFDILFDRLLREHRWFAVGFFAFVSFSALQFFLPLVLRFRTRNGTDAAATLSFIAAVALTRRGTDLRNPRRIAIVVLVFVAVLAGVHLLRPVVPPVPLRLTGVKFSGALNPRTLSTTAQFEKDIPAPELRRGRIYAVATIFSPERIPARMQMRFIQSRSVVRTSRTLDLIARPGGYRIWDSVRVPKDRSSASYRVEIWTEGQLLGKRTIRVID